MVEENQPEPSSSGQIKKRNRLIWLLTAIFLILGVAFLLYYLLVMRYHQTTDDAYVGCNMVDVTTRIAGTPIAYYCDDTNLVKEGQLIIQFDKTDFILDYEKQKANLALTVQKVKQLWQAVQQNKANVAQRKTLLLRALQDFANRHEVVSSNAISREDYDHADDDRIVAAWSLQLAEHQLEASIAELGTSSILDSPLIEQAKVQLRQSFVNLKRTSIYAPATGYVAKRSVQVGQWFTPTKPLLSIIPLDQVWVDANFKETQLTYMRIGQPVSFTADMYGSSVQFHGKLLGLQPGTGAVFSLLPPQNATGNWIKIVQRLPVRILLDPEEIRKHPLLVGLSCYVDVNISDTSGPQLAPVPSVKQVQSTYVYDIPMEEVEAVIRQIMEENLLNPQAASFYGS